MSKKLIVIIAALVACGCSTLVNQRYFRETRADKPVMSFRSEFNFQQNSYDVSAYTHYFEMKDFMSGPILPILPSFGWIYESCCGPKIFKDAPVELGLIILSPKESFTLDYSQLRLIAGQKSFEAVIVDDGVANEANQNLKIEKSVSLSKVQTEEQKKFKSRLAAVFRFPVKVEEIDSFTVEGIQLKTDQGTEKLEPFHFKKESGVGFKVEICPCR